MREVTEEGMEERGTGGGEAGEGRTERERQRQAMQRVKAERERYSMSGLLQRGEMPTRHRYVAKRRHGLGQSLSTVPHNQRRLEWGRWSVVHRAPKKGLFVKVDAREDGLD